MAYWFDQAWQSRVASAVEQSLQILHATKRFSWTGSVLQSLVQVSRTHCVGLGDSVVACGLKNRPEGCRREWLYDFCCWLEGPKPEQALRGIPIVAESEWGKWNDVLDDFDKITQANAGVKLMIFGNDQTPEDCLDRLFARAREFTPQMKDDALLLARWRPEGFEFRRSVRIGG